MSSTAPRPDRPGRHSPPADDPFLRGVEVVATLKEKPAREQVDAAIEEAGQRIVSISGGGDLAIDTVRAMTAIDVDSGEWAGAGDVDVFRLGVNMSAAEEAARQISLRNIGGLVAVDFVGMQQRRHQKDVVATFRNALAGWLGRASKILEMSELGVCEAAIARRERPIGDVWTVPSDEREALDALREIESVGWSARGSQIRALMSKAARDWLGARPELISALNDRIGARWTVETDNRPPGRAKVWSAS